MDMREIRFGIEIETIKRTREQVAAAIHSVVGGTIRHVGYPASHDPWEVEDLRGRKWQIVADASLSNVPKHLQAEIVSPVLTYADIEQLQEVVRAVRRAGCKVDERCGIHIHVDGAVFDTKKLCNLAKTFYKQEELILHALGVHAERLRYCRRLSDDFIRSIERRRPRTLRDLNRAWYGRENNAPMHYDSSRYVTLNLHNLWYRNTVEMRAANSTLHAGKVKAYIQFVLALAAKAVSARAASSRKREFNAESAKYDLRVLLLRLGMIGDEFKAARMHMMANMPGDAAFKTREQRLKHTAKRNTQAVAETTPAPMPTTTES
ncbi:amidoligase family protein [bacterium]|nr:amidoligase family protein [bacterium]